MSSSSNLLHHSSCLSPIKTSFFNFSFSINKASQELHGKGKLDLHEVEVFTLSSLESRYIQILLKFSNHLAMNTKAIEQTDYTLRKFIFTHLVTLVMKFNFLWHPFYLNMHQCHRSIILVQLITLLSPLVFILECDRTT